MHALCKEKNTVLHSQGSLLFPEYPSLPGGNWGSSNPEGHHDGVPMQDIHYNRTYRQDSRLVQEILSCCMVIRLKNWRSIVTKSKNIYSFFQTVHAPNYILIHILEDMSESEQKHKSAKSLGWRWRLRGLLTWWRRLVGDVAEGRSLNLTRKTFSLWVYTLVLNEKKEPRKDICSQDGTVGFSIAEHELCQILKIMLRVPINLLEKVICGGY